MSHYNVTNSGYSSKYCLILYVKSSVVLLYCTDFLMNSDCSSSCAWG